MQLIFVLLIVIGVVLILHGISRAAAGGDKPQQHDEEPRVEVVRRVPSVFDHKRRR